MQPRWCSACLWMVKISPSHRSLSFSLSHHSYILFMKGCGWWSSAILIRSAFYKDVLATLILIHRHTHTCKHKRQYPGLWPRECWFSFAVNHQQKCLALVVRWGQMDGEQIRKVWETTGRISKGGGRIPSRLYSHKYFASYWSLRKTLPYYRTSLLGSVCLPVISSWKV